MSTSNLAVDTSSYPNQLEEFARRRGQRCWQNPAKSSRYTTFGAKSSEIQWTISITHGGFLCEDMWGQPSVTGHMGNNDDIEKVTDTLTPEKEISEFQRYIRVRQLEEEAESWDIEARLMPPPLLQRRIRVKFRLIGKEAPRIFFDPDRD